MFFFHNTNTIDDSQHKPFENNAESEDDFLCFESVWGEEIYSKSKMRSTKAREQDQRIIIVKSNEKEEIYLLEDDGLLAQIDPLPQDAIKKKIVSPPGHYLFLTAEFLYSSEIVEGIFTQIINDWRIEHFEALNKNDPKKTNWINVRYTYAFLLAMWQKSPLGDLIEFFSKFAK